MKYDFDHVPVRLGTDSVKWSQYDPDVLPLWVADMDYPSAEPIRQALRKRIEHGVFGYPSLQRNSTDVAELRDLLVDRMYQRYQWEINSEDLIFLPGVITGFNLTCHALSEPGAGVLVQTPVYHHFLEAAGLAGMLHQEAPLELTPDGSYEIDWDTFEHAITSQTRVFILCNPHNPVGRVFRRDELERMADLCLRHKVIICSDEIHCDLVFKGQKHIPIASLDKEIAQKTITLMSPTKTFNLAGLQCAFAIVPNKELHQQLQRARKGLVTWVNLLGLTAALAAYRDGQEWLDQVLEYLEDNRDFLSEYVMANLPDVKMCKPEGTYLAWLDCRQIDLEECPYDFFLKEGRVALNDGQVFGTGGEGFARLNFACTRSTLAQALERMRLALQRTTG